MRQDRDRLGPRTVVVGGVSGLAAAALGALARAGARESAREPRHPREAVALGNEEGRRPLRDWEFRSRRGNRPR